MPTSCAVASCKTTYHNAKTAGLNVSFFSFPNDLDICRQWIKLCKGTEPINFKQARVCSLHFKDDDFERDLKSELLRLPSKRILKEGAIPSLRLSDEQEMKDNRSMQKALENISMVLKEFDDLKHEIDNSGVLSDSDTSEEMVHILCSKRDDSKVDDASLKAENSKLKQIIRQKEIELCKWKKKYALLLKTHRKFKRDHGKN